MKLFLVLLLIFELFAHFSSAGNESLSALSTTENHYACTLTQPCEIGCCGPLNDSNGKGNCGYSSDYCGDDCTSDCGRKSHGEITTATPQCSGVSAHQRTVGYNEAWNPETRQCDEMLPEGIPLGVYTHINFAFAVINPNSFHVAPMNEQAASRYQGVASLKEQQPSLKVWIAIGGYSMNNKGPTRTTFSDLAASLEKQDIFFESVVSFLLNNNFDGVDVDWEYPGAEDRGGRPEDFQNFVTLIERLRRRLNQMSRPIGLSITLPASQYYLSGFDLVHLEPHVDFLNVMTYDVHGVWDQSIASIGPQVLAHTNITEVNLALDFFWGKNVNPARINLGLAFYGRNYTLSSPECFEAGCKFSGAGRPGKCTNNPGILSATEISRILETQTINQSFVVEQAAVRIVVFEGDQWVAYDDEETLKMKLDFANKHCLGGTMVWAVDLDDGELIESFGNSMGKKKAFVRDGEFGPIGDFEAVPGP